MNIQPKDMANFSHFHQFVVCLDQKERKESRKEGSQYILTHLPSSKHTINVELLDRMDLEGCHQAQMVGS